MQKTKHGESCTDVESPATTRNPGAQRVTRTATRTTGKPLPMWTRTRGPLQSAIPMNPDEQRITTTAMRTNGKPLPHGAPIRGG